MHTYFSVTTKQSLLIVFVVLNDHKSAYLNSVHDNAGAGESCNSPVLMSTGALQWPAMAYHAQLADVFSYTNIYIRMKTANVRMANETYGL